MNLSVFRKVKMMIVVCTIISLLILVPYPIYCNSSEQGLSEKTENTIRKITDFFCISSGLFIGSAHILWNMSSEVNNNTALSVDILSALPSLAIGSYTGYLTSKWLSEKMINNYNDPYIIYILEGLLYSSLAGAVILTSSIMPLFITSYYTGSIDFNFDTGSGITGPLFASVSGGLGYGVVFGAILGSVYSNVIYCFIKSNSK